MRLATYLFCSILFSVSPIVAASASHGPFPAVSEFPELQKVLLDISFDEPARLSRIDDGRLISAVGFEKYAKRIYSVGKSGEVSIAVTTLMDFRAAYSLLTLLSTSNLQEGPPGDTFSQNPTSIRFFQARYWVRIDGRDTSEDLLKQVAVWVSNQLSPRGQKPPSLITHLPATGYDASSLKYFPGLKSFESYSGSQAFNSLKLNFDAEIAQARYALNNQIGNLTLLNFPTPEVGAEYFADFSASSFSEKDREKIYLKRAGPIVAILQGRMDPGSADKVLQSISHSYAVRWIFEKPKKARVMWGVPVRILHTVVNSLFFVILLCVLAILAGAGAALFLFLRRRRSNAPGGQGQTAPTRLRLR
jgi:hypothetical protein